MTHNEPPAHPLNGAWQELTGATESFWLSRRRLGAPWKAEHATAGIGEWRVREAGGGERTIKLQGPHFDAVDLMYSALIPGSGLMAAWNADLIGPEHQVRLEAGVIPDLTLKAFEHTGHAPGLQAAVNHPDMTVTAEALDLPGGLPGWRMRIDGLSPGREEVARGSAAEEISYMLEEGVPRSTLLVSGFYGGPRLAVISCRGCAELLLLQQVREDEYGVAGATDFLLLDRRVLNRLEQTVPALMAGQGTAAPASETAALNEGPQAAENELSDEQLMAQLSGAGLERRMKHLSEATQLRQDAAENLTVLISHLKRAGKLLDRELHIEGALQDAANMQPVECTVRAVFPFGINMRLGSVTAIISDYQVREREISFKLDDQQLHLSASAGHTPLARTVGTVMERLLKKFAEQAS